MTPTTDPVPGEASLPAPTNHPSGDEATTDRAGVTASVRLALPAEAAQVAAIQRRAWLASDLTRGLAEAVDLERATEVWWQAITRPPMAHYRVLVAVQPRGGVRVEGREQRQETVVCGFAAIGPSDDPDAGDDTVEVAEFRVDDAAAGMGHDDRLMNAVADTARADGYDRLTWWVTSTDDGLRRWLQDAGWAPDGAHRELGTDADDLPDATPVRVKQVRLHTDISRPA